MSAVSQDGKSSVAGRCPLSSQGAVANRWLLFSMAMLTLLNHTAQQNMMSAT